MDILVGRNWLFSRVMTAEVAERQKREAKLASLLLEDEDEVHDATNDAALLLRLISYVKSYHVKLVAAVSLMTGTALLTIARPWIVGQAIDTGIRVADIHSLRYWTVRWSLTVGVS